MTLGPALIGGVAAGLAVFRLALLMPARNCPNCLTPLPKFRRAKSMRQVMWGGWTCAKCGIEIDRKGTKRM